MAKPIKRPKWMRRQRRYWRRAKQLWRHVDKPVLDVIYEFAVLRPDFEIKIHRDG